MKTRKLNRWSEDGGRESADSRTSGPVSSVSAFQLADFPRAGFSLLELIGVLAVLAILASLLVPVFVRRIDQAARVRDAAELSGMATALRSYILRTGQIPDQPNLVSALANEMAVSATQILTNSRNFRRAFLVDPNLWIASGLPYVQSSITNGTGTTDANGVAIAGLNLRVLVLSSLAVPLPATIDFSNAWSTPDGSIPSTWTWSGRPDDLKIQRVDFTPLFKRVILNPVDTFHFGSLAIESGGQESFTNPVTQVLSNSWYLLGTALRLYDTNNPPGMQMKAVVQSDTSYVFENGAWRGQLAGWGTNGPIPVSPSPAANLFTMFSANLSAAPLNPNAFGTNGNSTLAILGDFYTFMTNYNSWAQGGFVGLPMRLTQATNTLLNVTQDMSR